MKYNVTAKCFEYNPPKELKFKVESPGTCPRCNLAWQPHCVCAVYTELDDENENEYDFCVDVMWLCPNCKCSSISTFNSYGTNESYLDHSFPNNKPEPEFYNGIRELSPSFVKIYKEALNAECHDLFEVAGMGYRKALEFLVKDYAIKFNPNLKEQIEGMNLSECVKEYIKHPDTAAIIERTIWIANDQVHYEKLHKDMGLEDLKGLLELSLNFITMDLRAKEAMKITKKKRKKAVTADRDGGKD